VTEITPVSIATTGAGVCTNAALTITPSVLVVAARLAGYQAIYDEVRIDKIHVTLHPILGSTTAGRVAFYLERDPAAGAVGSVALALGQRELAQGSIRNTLSLNWAPQEPADWEFNLLNPGTVSLGKFVVMADSLADGAGVALPNATTMYTADIRVAMTLRGRP